MLMVTNLNNFPSTLTVIPVPEGDVKKYRENFVVNENLKRLGCSGRSGLSLAPPAGATQAKFFQLYKTSHQLQLPSAVIELVKLCQIALINFGKLDPEYADGCLCDVTERAINEWWNEIGSEHYNAEPTDGILGPTSVAGLLGMLIGSRNRLSNCGAPVAKDAFDLYSMKRGVDYFQKTQKLKRTRRLDRHTLDRLRKVTAKAAAGDGWAVPKAVKSTVVELSGKGGEMVRGIVGRDKAGLSEIETLDIDHFISLAHGERTKWLWHGKPRRSGPVDNHGRLNESLSLPLSRDEQSVYVWSNSKTETALSEDDPEARGKEEKFPGFTYTQNQPGSSTSIPESPSDRDHLHKTVFRSVTGRMSDARNGFGRIKDAVGLRGHAHRHSKDEVAANGLTHLTYNLSPTIVSPPNSQPSGKALSWKEIPSQYQNSTPKYNDSTRFFSHTGVSTLDFYNGDYQCNLRSEEPVHVDINTREALENKEARQDCLSNDVSAPVSNNDSGIEASVCETEQGLKKHGLLLRRRHSIPGGANTLKRPHNDEWFPRHMSFSEVEDVVTYWEPISNYYAGDKLEDLRCFFKSFLKLQNDAKPWVEEQVQNVQEIEGQLSLDSEKFHEIYPQLVKQYETKKQQSREILGSERVRLVEAIKEIEILVAKLEYEINTFVSKVQDIEDGVSQLQRQVDDLEYKADELSLQLQTDGWVNWIIKTISSLSMKE
ncbi:hypothetical protein K3495_g9360 [Podosphaera aphanis]|nr:hypothetical protein K3495_g9360 [Podosphaera aphanis]